jgi:16S rRNA G966 N2-methylase RsmD
MILGDSLQVMGSLAEREKLRGKVQMVYIDPPFPGQLVCYGLGCGCASEGVHVDVEVGSVAA